MANPIEEGKTSVPSSKPTVNVEGMCGDTRKGGNHLLRQVGTPQAKWRSRDEGHGYVISSKPVFEVA